MKQARTTNTFDAFEILTTLVQQGIAFWRLLITKTAVGDLFVY
jgi:hypothetical protein